MASGFLHSLFRGIRHASGWDASDDMRNSHTHPPAGLLSDEAFRAGFAQLAKKQLSFDAWLYHPQIPELTELAHAFPETTIIINHIGGPLGIGPYSGKRESVMDQWKRNMAKLADCDNVCVKLGGLAMKICGFDWHKRDIPPTSDQLASANGHYYEFCIEHFGIQRCMFESNFPVDKLSCSYGVLWNAFKKIAGRYSAQERTALFHDNAARIYQLQAVV